MPSRIRALRFCLTFPENAFDRLRNKNNYHYRCNQDGQIFQMTHGLVLPPRLFEARRERVSVTNDDASTIAASLP